MASGLNLDMNSKKCTLEKIIDIKLRKKFLQGVLLDDVGNFLSIQFLVFCNQFCHFLWMASILELEFEKVIDNAKVRISKIILF